MSSEKKRKVEFSTSDGRKVKFVCCGSGGLKRPGEEKEQPVKKAAKHCTTNCTEAGKALNLCKKKYI